MEEAEVDIGLTKLWWSAISITISSGRTIFQYECPSSEKRAHYDKVDTEQEMLLMLQTNFNKNYGILTQGVEII